MKALNTRDVMAGCLAAPHRFFNLFLQLASGTVLGPRIHYSQWDNRAIDVFKIPATRTHMLGRFFNSANGA